MSRGEQGFTLIELMVALAIFGLAALALLRLEGATLATTARLQDQVLGQIVARNVAVAAVTDPVAPSVGVEQGSEQNGGRSWAWTRATAPGGDAGLLRIDVTVRAADGGQAGALTLFRPAT
ncbi:type II secretion system minor pseudopilin GspI [Sphingomonas sp. 1P06PA]|uniref:type II secretion system minor pseudopilin GspI n=1 Tax=Sphingomonas sp. 1P06PA TaxID=554121 RepID=UPI0039A4A29C